MCPEKTGPVEFQAFLVRLVVILHKLWLSRQTDREAVKKQRDRNQAMTIAQLLDRYLPQYQFVISELRMFPKDLVLEAQKEFQF